MMMRWVILSACTVALVSFAQADPPKNYYATASGKTGIDLRLALHDIIDDHRVIKYSSKNSDTADALSILTAYWPRVFSRAFEVCLDGVNLFVS